MMMDATVILNYVELLMGKCIWSVRIITSLSQPLQVSMDLAPGAAHRPRQP